MLCKCRPMPGRGQLLRRTSAGLRFHAVISIYRKSGSEFYRICRKVFLYHKRDLENDSVVKFPQVETGELLYLFQSVNKGISVYEQLS